MASRLVDVAVAAADGSVEWRKVAGDRAVLPVRGDVVARAQVGELDADPADLHSEHALVEIRAAVGAAYRVLVARATMLALATGGS